MTRAEEAFTLANQCLLVLLSRTDAVDNATLATTTASWGNLARWARTATVPQRYKAAHATFGVILDHYDAIHRAYSRAQQAESDGNPGQAVTWRSDADARIQTSTIQTPALFSRRRQQLARAAR